MVYNKQHYTIKQDAHGYIFTADDGTGMCGYAPSIRKLVLKAHVMMRDPIIVTLY